MSNLVWFNIISNGLDHGALNGLLDDDHTQYHNDARGDARYLQLDGSNANIDIDIGIYKITAKEFEGRGAIPVGFSGFFPKSLTGQPALPDWLAEYNGQTINDIESPFNGITLPNINGSGGTKRFLRGSTTSGSVGGTDTHRHEIQNASTNFYGVAATTPGAVSIAISQLIGIPFYTEYYNTKPHYYEVVYCLRIK